MIQAHPRCRGLRPNALCPAETIKRLALIRPAEAGAGIASRSAFEGSAPCGRGHRLGPPVQSKPGLSSITA